jgi:RecB family exonuclease
MENVSHEQIYDRLIAVEGKVDRIDNNTKGLVEAIDAMQGAIKVLGWIASAAKPILWVGGLIVAAGAVWQTLIKK